MKKCSKTHQIAPFQKKLSGKHAPKQTLGYHTRRKPLAQPPKKLAPLANPAYAHGLLLRNLFEEMRS